MDSPTIFTVLRKNRGQVGQVYGERIEQRRRALPSLLIWLPSSDDVPLVLDRPALEHFQNRIFALSENPMVPSGNLSMS